MSRFTTKALVACSLGALSSLAEAMTGTNVYGDFWVDFQRDATDADSVILKVTLPKDTWLGVVLGNARMDVGSDMIQIAAGSTPQA